MDLIPGPIYGGIVASPPNVNGNRLPKIIDKIDECKKGLAEIAEEKRKYHEFILSLTDKEAMVLLFYYWDELPINRIAEMLDVTNTRIQEYLRKLESKWGFYA